jgi:hypothetical protein
MKAIWLGGLLFMGAFGFALAYASKSRPRNAERRGPGDDGPGVFVGDTGSNSGTSDAAANGDGVGGDGGGGDGGGGD